MVYSIEQVVTFAGNILSERVVPKVLAEFCTGYFPLWFRQVIKKRVWNIRKLLRLKGEVEVQ